MPYLPIDFDGREDAEKVAAFIGVHPGIVSWALQEMWLHAFREHQAGRADPDLLSELVLFGCLGQAGSHPRAVDAFVELRFLERVGPKYRVRGAAKWLFGLEGKSRGGHASKSNLIPGARQKAAQSSRETETGSLGYAETPAETPAETQPIGRLSALTASSQQPTAKKKESKSVSSSIDDSRQAKTQVDMRALVDLPPEPARPTKAPEKQTDPQHAQLTRSLVAAYERKTGSKYGFQGGKDARAVATLLGFSRDIPEHVGRWEAALEHKGYPTVATLAEFAMHWNRFAKSRQPPKSIEDTPCLTLT